MKIHFFVPLLFGLSCYLRLIRFEFFLSAGILQVHKTVCCCPDCFLFPLSFSHGTLLLYWQPFHVYHLSCDPSTKREIERAPEREKEQTYLLRISGLFGCCTY